MTGSIAAVVLAGGASRRMGGGEKFLLPFAGSTLLGHVIDRLSPQAAHVAISANCDPALLGRFGLPVLADPPDAPAAGPLSGVLAGMEWAGGLPPSIPHLLTAASDTPFLPADLAARLLDAAAPGRIVIAGSHGRSHPVFGLWPLRLAAPLRTFLQAGGSRVMEFVAAQDHAVVDFTPGAGPDPFFNVNTPADFAKAERIAETTT